MACRGKTGVFTFGSRVGSRVLSQSTQSTRRSNDHHPHLQRRAYSIRSLPFPTRLSILDRHRTTGDAHPRHLTPPNNHNLSMTAAIVTRTPLHNLSMTGAQTNGIKRKPTRHHNDHPDEDDRPVKKVKPASTNTSSRNASQNTVKKAKKCESAVSTNIDAQMLMRRRPAYDDDDDGFVFTRLRTKKAKGKAPDAAPEPETTAGASAPVPEAQSTQQLPPPTDEHAPKEATQPPRKRVRKTLPASPEPTPRRRSKRLSGNSPVRDQAPATTSKLATELQSQQRHPATPPPASTNDENVAPAADGSPALEQGELTIHKKRGPAKIPLPFGETPVLRRNKEMRKLSAEKSRRSSSGMRGRRASSLIEAGSSRGTWILFIPLSRVYAQSCVSCFLRP